VPLLRSPASDLNFTLALAVAAAWGEDDKPAILLVDDTFAGALDDVMLVGFCARIGAEIDAGRIAQAIVATAHPGATPEGWTMVRTEGAGSVEEAVVEVGRKKRARRAGDAA
jgi:hypothetical protein